MSMLMVRELELIEQFRYISLVSQESHISVRLGMLKSTSSIIEEIKEGQKIDIGLVDRLVLINQNKGGVFRIDEYGVMMFKDKVCIPDVPELKKSILEEGHKSGLSINPNATKMYQDLKKLFSWPRMKKEVVEFANACLTCQMLKIEHHKLLRLIQPLSIPEWKWDNISINFIK